MADLHIRQSFRQRRVGGGLMVFLAIPITLIWVRFGLPPRWMLGDLLFFLGGPGMLLLGLWAAFPRRAAQIRLTITDDVVRIFNRGNERVIDLDQLENVRWRYVGRNGYQRMTFKTDAETVDFEVVMLTHDARDIINLIAIRLENKGKVMRERAARITGGPSGIWDVSDGAPFEDGV